MLACLDTVARGLAAVAPRQVSGPQGVVSRRRWAGGGGQEEVGRRSGQDEGARRGDGRELWAGGIPAILFYRYARVVVEVFITFTE